MLASLKIENVAVIEKAEVNFTPGFNVLTGETGAGKSILIDSINAILGNRTSRELVRSGAQKACIWATFESIPASVKKQLEKCGYEVTDDLLLYREINAEGKGSCRVNGMPATAAVVRDISSGLLSIHGQHDSQSLTNPALHLGLLDQYAQNRDLFAEYYRRYRELVTVKRQLDALNASESDKQRRIEALTAEIDTIDAAALQPGEEKTLQERKNVITHAQSGDIAGAVSQEDQLGAGDQGIMYGHACSETEELLPLPVVLANRLTCLLSHVRRTGRIQGLGPDGKAQVSVEYVFGQPSRITSVVVSCQHDSDKDMEMLRREIQTEVIQPALRELPPDEGTEILINPSGRFVLGGFEADTGLTGRKLMVDTYGGLAPHGGGALSGKDGSKVDRSGTYMARYIAKNIVAAGLAEKCTVSLAYAIGKADPVAVDIDTHGSGEYGDDVLAQAVRQVFELTPAGMIRTLGLDKPIFAQFCNYGHFTHQDAPWEQCDCADLLWNVCRVKEAGVSSR